MVIRKEGALFQARPTPEWWKKESMEENWAIINKNGHSTFHTGKPGDFNSLREEIWLMYYDTVTLKLIENESQCPKKCCGY